MTYKKKDMLKRLKIDFKLQFVDLSRVKYWFFLNGKLFENVLGNYMKYINGKMNDINMIKQIYRRTNFIFLFTARFKNKRNKNLTYVKKITAVLHYLACK